LPNSTLNLKTLASAVPQTGTQKLKMGDMTITMPLECFLTVASYGWYHSSAPLGLTGTPLHY